MDLHKEEALPRPIAVRPFKLEKGKSVADSNREWRRAFAMAITVEEKILAVRMLFEMGVYGQHLPALINLMDRGMGKPGVAGAQQALEDIAVDSIDAVYSALTDDELKEYLRLQAKIAQAGQPEPAKTLPPPVYVNGQPALPFAAQEVPHESP